MKRFLAFILTASFLLTSCSNNDTADTLDTAGESGDNTRSLTELSASPKTPYMDTGVLVVGLENLVSREEVDILFTTCTKDEFVPDHIFDMYQESIKNAATEEEAKDWEQRLERERAAWKKRKETPYTDSRSGYWSCK